MITTRKEKGARFATFEQALTAFSAMQFDYMKRGFLVSCNVCTEVGYIQLTIHFDYHHVPSEPSGSMYTIKEYSSFNISEVIDGKPGRVRTVDYFFEVDNQFN